MIERKTWKGDESGETLFYYSLTLRLEIAASGQFRELNGRSVAYLEILGLLAGTFLLGMLLQLTLDMWELRMILGAGIGQDGLGRLLSTRRSGRE